VHKNFPESWHGLGHVTPIIFGSTVGYPSDSLASCFYRIAERIDSDTTGTPLQYGLYTVSP